MYYIAQEGTACFRAILGRSMRKLISIFLFIVHNVFAQSVATVLFAIKKVTVLYASAEGSLSHGSSLEEGDSIITSDGSFFGVAHRTLSAA